MIRMLNWKMKYTNKAYITSEASVFGFEKHRNFCFLSKRVIASKGADMNDVTSRDEHNKKTRPFCNKFNTRT